MFQAELATRKYKSAAKRFLMAHLDHCNIPDIMSTQVLNWLRIKNNFQNKNIDLFFLILQ